MEGKERRQSAGTDSCAELTSGIWLSKRGWFGWKAEWWRGFEEMWSLYSRWLSSFAKNNNGQRRLH